MHLRQDLVHVLIGAVFGHLDAERIHNILAHGEADGTGGIFHIGQRV